MKKTIENYCKLLNHNDLLKSIGTTVVAELLTQAQGKDLDDLVEDIEINAADMTEAVMNAVHKAFRKTVANGLAADNPPNVRYDKKNISVERIAGLGPVSWRIDSRYAKETIAHIPRGLILNEEGIEHLTPVLSLIQETAYNAGYDEGQENVEQEFEVGRYAEDYFTCCICGQRRHESELYETTPKGNEICESCKNKQNKQKHVFRGGNSLCIYLDCKKKKHDDCHI